jgi:hypothetical protein
MRFKCFLENNIFGFKTKAESEKVEIPQTKPIRGFNFEQMMEFLSKKKLGVHEPNLNFMNEIQWGTNYGAIKLEVSPSYKFIIKQLAFDLQGAKQWVAKKMFQLNRQGYGGYEDSVANEIYNQLALEFIKPLEKPESKYDNLENLVYKISEVMRNTSPENFIFKGIKKTDKFNYVIAFEVGAQGVEARDHLRVEQLQTQVNYNETTGMVKITNSKVTSAVGGPHEWKIQPSDLELTFFPTQEINKIAETIAVHMKYY